MDAVNEEIDLGPMGLVTRSHEDVASEWRKALLELGLSAVELADYMKKQGGDYRPYNTVLRSIQRMVAGETRVSGELFVIVNMLLRQKRRLSDRYPEVRWQQHSTGSHSADVEGWTVFVSPQSKGRWLLSCRAPDGYSPPFGRWQESLEIAKRKALSVVEEGMNDIAELKLAER